MLRLCIVIRRFRPLNIRRFADIPPVKQHAVFFPHDKLGLFCLSGHIEVYRIL
ncbi:hypothetical protein EIO60_00949|nr:hypothetical protein [Candidatus Pantoea persica]